MIGTEWIDINKGDDSKPDIRSRLVAKDFKADDRPELFAATPPTEAMRIILSEAATMGKEEKVIMINDVRRAYFYAKALRPIWIELPEEDYTEEDMKEDRVGLLEMSLYGTRDAARN